MYEYVYWKYKNKKNIYECPYTFFNRMLIFIPEIYLLNDSFDASYFIENYSTTIFNISRKNLWCKLFLHLNGIKILKNNS